MDIYALKDPDGAFYEGRRERNIREGGSGDLETQLFSPLPNAGSDAEIQYFIIAQKPLRA